MTRNEILQIALDCAVENGIELKHIEVQQFKEGNGYLVRLDYYAPEGGIKKRFSDHYPPERLKLELDLSIRRHLETMPPSQP